MNESIKSVYSKLPSYEKGDDMHFLREFVGAA